MFIELFLLIQELSPQLSTETHKRGSISKILSFKSSHKRERKLAELVSLTINTCFMIIYMYVKE